ncbi:MAG: porin [Holosporaceae bacterium]|nr:porin [Holosporaceae bacterium]
MKTIVFLALLLSMKICEATDAGEANIKDEGKLLNEMVNDKLKEEGIDCPLSFRGTLNFSTLFVSQDVKNNNDSCLFALEGDIFLKNLNECDQYNLGFEIGVKASSGIMKQGSPIVRTAYVFAESPKIGILKVGFTPTMADSMTINGGSVLVGYGGAASQNLSLFYNESAGSFVDQCFPFDDGKAAKIAYLSSSLAGFTLGVSFTPDSRSANPFKTMHPKPRNPEISEEKANFPGMRTAYSKNIVTGGVAYEFGDSEAFNGKIALCGWAGKGKTSVTGMEVDKIRAYNVGAVLGYKSLKLALGYSDNCKSLRSKRYATADISNFDEDRDYHFTDSEVGLKPGADAGKTYSAGVSYAINDRLTASAGYFRSEVKFSSNEKSTADVFSLAVEYVLHRSASLYAEYDKIKSNSCARAQAYGKACGISSTGKNQGNMFIIGAKINI